MHHPAKEAPVLADMMQVMAGLATKLVCEHKAVEFSLTLGRKTALVLGAYVPLNEAESANAIRAIEAAAAQHGYTVDGKAGPEAQTLYGKVRLVAFAMRDLAEEPTVQ